MDQIRELAEQSSAFKRVQDELEAQLASRSAERDALADRLGQVQKLLSQIEAGKPASPQPPSPPPSPAPAAKKKRK
jgi:hypothetical protein